MSEIGRQSLSLRPSEVVISAIQNLEKEKGSSRRDIISFISDKYELNSNHIKNHVDKALKRGVCFGVLSENNGLYRIRGAETPTIQQATFEEKRNIVKRKLLEKLKLSKILNRGRTSKVLKDVKDGKNANDVKDVKDLKTVKTLKAAKGTRYTKSKTKSKQSSKGKPKRSALGRLGRNKSQNNKSTRKCKPRPKRK